MCRTSGVIKEGLLSSTDLSCRYAVIYSRSTPRLSKKDFHHRPPYSKEIAALRPTMHSTRGWWVLVAYLLVAYLGNFCLAAGLSLNDLKYHRSTDHVGRHHHGTQTAEDTLSESTTNEPDVEDVKNIENACCRRQEKFVSIGFGK
ncbi:hypothetical protein L798_12341 [Zootermopsis nevadensis]|uniref:Uncharacterized protein n=1 Tax=Zootermopsis nevadensis TaxID=136037 RepID=A0A067R677_ZOONE|nr:hypothetical protein L798_12341 [Zootermopsis nevadensis]